MAFLLPQTLLARDSMLRALYASPVRPSGCLSVSHTGASVKNDRRIMQLYGSPISIFVGRPMFHPEILTGSPERWRQTREGWGKQAIL